MKKVGFIGLGNMGHGMCDNLVKAGHEVTVYDANPEAMKRYEGKATLAAAPDEVCANSDYIFLSLPNSEIIETVVRGFVAQGVEGKYIIDVSTAYPLSTKQLAEEVRAAGGHMVDAPVMSGPAEAEAGTVESVIGGADEDIDAVEDLVKCYCSKLDRVGSIGNGHLLKIAMNFCGLGEALIFAQVYPLVEKLGFPAKDFHEVLKGGPIENWVSNFYGEKYKDKNYRLDFAMNLGRKDLRYMKQLCDDLKVPGFMLDGALALCDATMDREPDGEVFDFSHAGYTMYDLLDLND